MKKTLGLLAAALLMAAPALAEEAPAVPNCDFQPSCEVAPGIYGKISSPAQSKFKLSIGGYVKLDYAYNSVNLGTATAPSGGWLLPSTGLIPKTNSIAGQSNQSLLTAKQTRFWLKVAGPDFLGAKTSALIEADFAGFSGNATVENENASLRMRHAYGALDWTNTQILFGQTSDIFGPMVLSTVDFRSGAGWGAPNQPRVAQLRLTQKVPFSADNALKLVVGVQNPVQDTNVLAAANPTTAVANSYGDVLNVAGQAMFISKALGVAPGYYGMAMNSFTAGFFGLYGTENVMLNNRRLDSWGYGFYTFVPVLKSKDGKNRAMTLSFEGQAYMAANMAFDTATPQAAVASGSPGVFNPATGNNLAPGKAYGFAGQLIFYPIQDLGITAGYSRRNIYNYFDYQKTVTGAGGLAVDYAKSSSMAYANIAYDLNAAVRVAAEYENANTQYGTNPFVLASNGTGSANIGRFAMYYFF